MKKIISKFALIAAITFSLHACSTPEERAEVVEGAEADTTTSPTSPSIDSMNSTSNGMENDSSGATTSGDSSSANKKMESFRHVPIDTITSLKDTSKQ